MGWKGTVRSIGAAMRAAERDAKRRQKELERRHKQYQKMQALERAAYDVDVHENHIEVIQSIHKECGPPVDWNKIASSKEPLKPDNNKGREESATLNANLYKPSFIDRIFKKEAKKRISFAEKITQAIQLDDNTYKENLRIWEKDVIERKESVDIAHALLKGEKKAKIEAIENLRPFSEISNLGSSLSVSVTDNGLLEATVHVHGVDIVPSEVKSLLKSGKLSIKNMPKGRFNEIYQDYVCSCILRVANEILAIIPDKLVMVTAVDRLLNSRTGHLEEAPMVSAVISRSTLKNLNLQSIDPSDSMSNFVHNMSFKKTKGFDPVSRVDVGRLSMA